MASRFLCGRKILITAGPTWVPVDDVRVIGNISTGEMGLLLAKEARSSGADVELLLGPVGDIRSPRGVRVFRFRYFADLRDVLRRRLREKRYDVILHAAAVSDYLLRRVRGKISSKRRAWVLKLKAAPKLLGLIRRLAPEACLVMFKLETRLTDRVLLQRARQALSRARADFVVANTLKKTGYRGYFLDKNSVLARADSKQGIVKALMKILGDALN